MISTSSLFDLYYAQTAACIFMTGLIWMVQLVHYPAFRFVEVGQFKKFQNFHSERITWIVAPVMAIELVTASILLFLDHKSLLAQWNAASVLLLWLLTAIVSVPIHNQLARSHSKVAVEKLILTNWPRTIVWSARSVVLLAALKGP